MRILVVGLWLLAQAGMGAIRTVSTRPDMVTGGDVLVEITDVGTYPLVRLNGSDITPVLHSGGGASLLGLLTGLKSGENQLEVVNGSRATERLILKNHSLKGPVFSGTQEQPFVCQTREFALPDGTSLGDPKDDQCSVDTVVSYVYKPTDGSAFRLLRKPAATLPSDVGWTTTSIGVRVPFVVRVETGTLNRAIYQFAVLHDPATEPPPTPFASPQGWNRRLLYSFGGGCNGGWNKQGVSLGLGGILHADIVGQGYAEASATLNVFGNNCNSVIAAETMMMVKERFIETIGVPQFTFGRGGSGGAEQQIPIADNYPGLLDGIIPGATFPDVLSNAQMITDVQLLNRYFDQHIEEYTDHQKLAILGTARVANFAANDSRIRAGGMCPDRIPPDRRYDSKKNPDGVRCDIFQHTVAVFGADPATGFALRPLDNVGVQYGLNALNAGVISKQKFIDLNAKVGGFDQNGVMQPARTVADTEGLRAAYRSGQLTNGGLGLARVPVIDVRGYTDTRPNGDVHMIFHSFSLRERMRKAIGSSDNQVLWISSNTMGGQISSLAIRKMDEWLTRLSQDHSSDPLITRIARAKPEGVADSCWTRNGERIIETQSPSGGACNQLYPAFQSVRMMAGGPAANDVLKCTLKPIGWSDYKVSFTPEEMRQLETIFPTGVCDWSKPGVEQQPPSGVWLRY